MEVLRGLRRLALVVAVIWIAFWSYWAWSGYSKIDHYDKYIAVLNYEKRATEWPGSIYSVPEYPSLSEDRDEGGERLYQTKLFGLGIPFALLILTPLGIFIYRGFKPQPSKDT